MLPYMDAMRLELANWFFHYFEPRTQMRMITPVKEARHIGLMGEDLNAFFNTLRVLDEKQFQALEKALHVMIPSITSIDVQVNNLGEIELSLKDGNKPISTRILSDGTIRILGLLTLGGAKDPPALIGLEEPENGIHPERLDLVALLLESLTNYDSQVVVTSHSPTLLDFLPVKSLYLCRQMSNSTNIIPLSSLILTDAVETRPVSERLLRGDFNAYH